MLTQDLDPGGGAAPQGSPADPPPGGRRPSPAWGGQGADTRVAQHRPPFVGVYGFISLFWTNKMGPTAPSLPGLPRGPRHQEPSAGHGEEGRGTRRRSLYPCGALRRGRRLVRRGKVGMSARVTGQGRGTSPSRPPGTPEPAQSPEARGSRRWGAGEAGPR